MNLAISFNKHVQWIGHSYEEWFGYTIHHVCLLPCIVISWDTKNKLKPKPAQKSSCCNADYAFVPGINGYKCSKCGGDHRDEI